MSAGTPSGFMRGRMIMIVIAAMLLGPAILLLLAFGLWLFMWGLA